jgi:hypothetical protein
MVKPGKVTEGRKEETEEYNSGPYKYLTNFNTQTLTPST